MSREKMTPMREQPADVRRRNFDEVPLGYTTEEAIAEAARCLDCRNAPCVQGCPVGIDIPGFLRRVKVGDFAAAISTIKASNSLPAVCGRVCPQETQCQGVCTLAKRFEPVGIGRLERFCADWEAEHEPCCLAMAPDTGRRVAVIGAGPAGLTAAGELRKLGHDVTVFELLHAAGGVLMYGIPEFRLPKAIVKREIDALAGMGVQVRLNQVIGQSATVSDLLADGYEAVFIGTGAGLPQFLGVPGESLNGVYSANEFLTRANLMRAYRFPEFDTPIRVGRRTLTVGGGNVAMDAARTALRLGAEESMIVYRRSEAELPARQEEVHHAKEEGIVFHLLTNPVEFVGNGGRVASVRCQKMELGEADESGRRRPVAVAGSEFELEADAVIIAIGNGPHPLVPRTTPGLALTRWGNIQADPETGATSLPGVYAGGDIVTGAATVIEAMGAGKRAARAIDAWLSRT
ncbi:MAG: NADPH-dependent glutamate synthase [Candidatus Bipolaricaulota bacterium]